MVQTRREVEITLHSIRVPVTGAGLDTDTSHLLSASLIWPRLGVAGKSASQPCALQNGAARFDTVPWGRRILFKEAVEGRFALGLALTEALDDEELEKFLRFWTGAFLAVGADLVGAAAAPAGKLAAAPLDYAAKAVAKYPGALPLAEGLVEINAAELPPGGGDRLLTVRLTAARSLAHLSRRSVNSRPRVRRTLLLEKGADNGEVTLAIRSL